MRQDIESILYDAECIGQRIFQMGTRITCDYQDKDLLLVGVLKGSFVFLADLARAIDLPAEVDFMVVSSYGSGTRSSGMLTIAKDLSVSVEGRHVLIVEDIVDSGLTLSLLTEDLRSRGAASVEVAVLLEKDAPRSHRVDCAYSAFHCPDAFLVGYGLDYAERYRNLPYIGILKPEVYEDRAQCPDARQPGR
ncbi:MAG: hypoxanthine phosphoribosyltransferase [Eggerthellaceae bacterium]